MTARTRRFQRLPVALAVILLVAVAFGAAAAFVTTQPPTSAPSIDPSFGVDGVSGEIAIGSILAFVFLYFGFLVYQQVANGRAPLPSWMVVSAIVGLLVLVAFAVAFHLEGNGSGFVIPRTTPGLNNSTHGVGPNGTGTPPNQSAADVAPHLASLWWLPYVVLVGLVLVVVVLVIPYAIAVRKEREEVSERSKHDVRNTLSAALGALDQPENLDPRTLIVQLYAQLIARVERIGGVIDTRTAREIREEQLVRLGIGRKAAADLTSLFEEARYSTHAMGPKEAERAREVFQAALDDLHRAGWGT